MERRRGIGYEGGNHWVREMNTVSRIAVGWNALLALLTDDVLFERYVLKEDVVTKDMTVEHRKHRRKKDNDQQD